MHAYIHTYIHTFRWPAIERWLSAFEERPSYLATKSDYYTHVMDIPPQYGPSYPVFGKQAGKPLYVYVCMYACLYACMVNHVCIYVCMYVCSA